MLISQRSVARAMEIARTASVCFISAGELTEDSLLRRQNMLSKSELESLRAAGAIGDTNGIFFDKEGRQIDHEMNQRTIALGFEELQKVQVVLLIAGQEKAAAAKALLKAALSTVLL